MTVEIPSKRTYNTYHLEQVTCYFLRASRGCEVRDLVEIFTISISRVMFEKLEEAKISEGKRQ